MTVRRSPQGIVFDRLHWRMGADALEHLIFCLRPAQLHGRIYHMGNYTTARPRFVKLDC